MARLNDFAQRKEPRSPALHQQPLRSQPAAPEQPGPGAGPEARHFS